MKLTSAISAALFIWLLAPGVARADWCPGNNPPFDPRNYSYAGGGADFLPAPRQPWNFVRTDVYMSYSVLNLTDSLKDHSQGAVAVVGTNEWIEAGIGIFGHRRDKNGNPKYDRPPADGLPDPIVWSSYHPASGEDQFVWENWADVNSVHRFEIKEVATNEFRIWIDGLESNLTWYGGSPYDGYHYPPNTSRHIGDGDVFEVFGEDNSPGDQACDRFDIGLTSIYPPLTWLVEPYRVPPPPPPPPPPWASCWNQIVPPWNSGDLYLSSQGPSSPQLCCPICYSPVGFAPAGRTTAPVVAEPRGRRF